MKKLLAIALPMLLAVMSARADLIYQETFNYSNGLSTVTSTNVVGGVLVTNWLLHSGTADSYVNNHRLEVSSSTAYLGVTATRSGDVHRLFSITNNCPYTNVQQVLYASFIVNFTNLPTAAGAYFAHFYYSSSIFPCRIWAMTNGTVLPNTFRIGVDPGTASPPNQVYPVDLALNTDYQIVVGYCPVTSDPGGLADDSVTLWINPVSFGDASVTTGDAFAPGTSIANSFAFRQASGFGGFLTASNLVVTTTFVEALTNGAATNAVAPKIVYQPAAVTTNFQNDVVSLSAVADGQGLGSLIYQWQVSSSPANTSPANVSNPNGNSNILGVPTGTVGTSYYTLVATTPWGLSVTSSVAKMVIKAPVAPPTFVTQPVSQTDYNGQTVTLTTTVLSPGNITYTWYSNNVVVTDGQQDSGTSSSYIIPNVTPANSATYYVSVTNDTTTAGIVSTNAVLTVLPAPVVTIAYLRTLVDPNNNYQTTNSTLPYQVTGTITTATNLTSGNTSSYYLQDGTAGINIFATFGSTFRPALGDVVTFVGVMSSYSSGLELYADTTDLPYTSYTDTGTTAPLPAPVSIPFTFTNNNYANVNYQIAGERVQLSGVYFGTNAGNAIVAGFMAVTNVSGQTAYLWFSAQDTNTLGNILPVYASSVTGVVFGSMNPNLPVGGIASPNFAVAVTQFSDIVAVTPPVSLNVGYSGGTVTLSWSAIGYSLQGATSLTGTWNTITGTSPYTFTIPPGDPALGSSAAGFYRLKQVP
jgi:hypothetical protein